MRRFPVLPALLLVAVAAGCSEPGPPASPAKVRPMDAGVNAVPVVAPAPTGCAEAISPASAIVPASGATRRIAIKAPAGCACQVESRAEWLRAASTAAAQGDREVTVTIAPNPDAAPRSAVIFAGGQRLSVFQDGTRALVHPRLWMDPEIASRLKAVATDTNPLYKALSTALAEARQDFDTRFKTGKWADNGGVTWSRDVSEAYAEFFAFASILANDEGTRADLRSRARTLLMYVIDKASPGPKAGEPFRDPAFATSDRASYWGEGFGLTVDWIYPALSAEDKAKIQKDFLRWAAADLTAANAPWLIKRDTKKSARWAANNYYLNHLRNLTMMSLSLDPADDPAVDPGKPREAIGNTVGSYLGCVVSSWLPPVESAFGEGGDASGGLPAEGFMYGIWIGSLHEALLAMHTAGRLGEREQRLLDMPYWDRITQGFLHSLAPAPTVVPKLAYLGPVFPVASYGDVLRTWAIPDWINLFGSLGVYSARTGHAAQEETARWIAEHALQGGAKFLEERASRIWGNSTASAAILSYMLFVPGAPPPPDPRKATPLTFVDRSLGRILARSGWGQDASLFAFMCSWKSINHQIGDCGQLDFYRGGEWLTTERAGYANKGVISTTDYHNTLSLQNDPLPAGKLSWFEPPINQRGSQYLLDGHGGDPTFRASAGQGSAVVHAEADATTLYNRTDKQAAAEDITHASRVVVWLQPDHVVVYDRATSKTAGRFKRFNLMLPGPPVIAGRTATAKTSSGQQIFVSTLLPVKASLTAPPLEEDNEAEGQTMRARLVVEDDGRPSDVRFLHVIEGAGAGARPSPVELCRGAGETPFDGVLVRGTAVLFPVKPIPEGGFQTLTYTVPASIKGHLITGLPQGRYDVAQNASGGRVEVRVTRGSALLADEAGGIAIGSAGR